MKEGFIFLTILFLPIVFAANIDYSIVNQKVLVEIEMNETEFYLFNLPESFEHSENKIKYIDDGLVEKSRNEYFFISKSSGHLDSEIKVLLPEGAVLNEDYFIFPKNYFLSTNGKNIIVEWKEGIEKEILIPYKMNSENNFFIYILSGLALIIGIYFYLIKKRINHKKYTQNLFKEEKKIMDYLLKKKECWTKEMTRDLGISKVRLSRKLRNLEEKELVEKIPYGNENKIKLKSLY